MAVRWIAALAAFLIVAFIGIVGFGNFTTGIDEEVFFDIEGANSFALIFAIALIVAFLAYAAVEYLQTRSLASISRQFDTRTVVLIASLLRPDLVTEKVSETLACDTSSDPYLAGSLYRSEGDDRAPTAVAVAIDADGMKAELVARLARAVGAPYS